MLENPATHLHCNTVHKSRPPLRNSEHNTPAWSSYCLLSFDGGLDIMVFIVNPFLIMAIEVKLLKDSYGFVMTIGLHKMTRRFGEEQNSEGQDASWNTLKRKRNSPLNGTIIGCLT